jgi:cholesterol transport system auxiliary component
MHPLWVSLLLLAGCGTTAPLPEDRFYQLNPGVTTESRVAPVLSGGLIIDRVSADPLRSGRAILYSDNKTPLELRRYHYEFWVDQPTKLVQQALHARFRGTGFADRVLDGDDGANARYRLSTRLQRFEQLRDSTHDSADVVVELEATLYANSSRTVIWTQRYHQRQPVGEPGMHATVTAMEAALHAVLDSMGSDLSVAELDH